MAKNKIVKNFAITFFFLSMLCLLSGCLEELELDEKVIVAMVGIDKTEIGTYVVTMGLIDTRRIEEKEHQGIHVYSIEGDTIFEAVRASILKLGRQPQWPYIKVLVLGPAFSTENVIPILDFFNRNNEVQPNPYIAFSHVLAEEIINLDTHLSNIPGVIVEDQFRLQHLIGYAPDIELHQFTEMMLTPEQVGMASIINKVKDNNNFIPKIEGTAVIKGGKWIGDLSNIETRGLLWVRKEVRGGIIVIESFEGEGKAALEIIGEGDISIEPLLENGQLSVQIHVEQLVSIAEILADIELDEESVDKIKLDTEKAIINEIETTLQKSMDWEADIFEVYRAVHRKYPTYWQEHKDNWGEIYSTINFQVNATVDIKTMGLLRAIPLN